jgi:OOP family OmpA-OmpF porin
MTKVNRTARRGGGRSSDYQILMFSAAALFVLCGSALAEESPFETYLRFDGGVQRQQDLTTGNSDGGRISFDRGLRFDIAAGGFGTEFCAVELEAGLLHNLGRAGVSVLPNSSGQTLDVYQIPFMLNAIARLPIGRHLSLRAGPGFGYVYSVFCGGDLASVDRTFAVQGIIGAHYAIGEDFDLGVSYKFLATTEHCLGLGVSMSGTRSHALLAGLAFRF